MNTPENHMRPIGEALIYVTLIWAVFFASCAFAHYTSAHYPAMYYKIVRGLVWIIIAACIGCTLALLISTAQSILKWFKS